MKSLTISVSIMTSTFTFPLSKGRSESDQTSSFTHQNTVSEPRSGGRQIRRRAGRGRWRRSSRRVAQNLEEFLIVLRQMFACIPRQCAGDYPPLANSLNFSLSAW
jgi:hypothetical protein